MIIACRLPSSRWRCALCLALLWHALAAKTRRGTKKSPPQAGPNIDSKIQKHNVDSSSTTEAFRYNICNGLSNQLLYHSASIAIAHKEGFQEVEIPDYYILQGTQTSDANVLPTQNNSAPFGFVFDREHFLYQLKQNLGLTGHFVRFEKDAEAPECPGMRAVQTADPQTLKIVLDSFRPSPEHVVPLIEIMSTQLPDDGRKSGVCLHHRDGSDWHEHCKRWGNTRRGPNYGGNCLTVKGHSFVDAIMSRGLVASKLRQHQKQGMPMRWIYYCGDHQISQELWNLSSENVSSSRIISAITSRRDLLNHTKLQPEIASLLTQQQSMLAEKHNLTVDLLHSRDFWALIDFSLCQQLPIFVGNSVSTFSALQIALRPNSYWYNSQFIPLGTMWRVYPIPIVYSYSESENVVDTQAALKASILSARQHLPTHNPIHVLYNGVGDQEFREWLQSQNVTRHDHQLWANFTNSRYISPQHWLLVDVPMYIESEYALALDARALVVKSFTLADFGKDLTYSIGTTSALDGGVMLMNVPFLRRTHERFVQFALQQETDEHPQSSAVRLHELYKSFYKQSSKQLPKQTSNMFQYSSPVESGDSFKLSANVSNTGKSALNTPPEEVALKNPDFQHSSSVKNDVSLQLATNVSNTEKISSSTPEETALNSSYLEEKVESLTSVKNDVSLQLATNVSNTEKVSTPPPEETALNSSYLEEKVESLTSEKTIAIAVEPNPHPTMSASSHFVERAAGMNKEMQVQLSSQVSFSLADVRIRWLSCFVVVAALISIRSRRGFIGQGQCGVFVLVVGLTMFNLLQGFRGLNMNLQMGKEWGNSNNMVDLTWLQSYTPASCEHFILSHMVELGYDTGNQRNASGCKIWLDREESPVYWELQGFRKEIFSHQHIVKNFRPNNVTLSSNETIAWDIREYLQHNSSICESVDLDLKSIFQSGQLSRIPVSGELVEPLLPPFRHPDVCFNKRQFLLDTSFLVHDFGTMCRRLKENSRIVFFDLGASLNFHIENGSSAESPALETLELIRLYQRFGFHFSHIYAFEKTPTEPDMVYERVPADLISAFHWINVGVNTTPGHPLNPYTLLKNEFRPDDLILVKLDIDSPEPELSLVNQLLDDVSLSELVDTFYFENHVHVQETAEEWGDTMEGSIKDALELFTKLRSRGIAAHFWV